MKYLKTILLILFISTPCMADLVKVGVVMPLTGNQAVYGVDALRVLKLLAPEGYLKNGRHKFQFIIEDGKCGVGRSATTAAQKLINVDQVKFLILGCSGEILQAGLLAQKEKIVAVGFAGGHPEIKNLGDYVFRIHVDITKAVQLIAGLITKENQGKIALITEESSFTLGIKDQMLAMLGARAGLVEDIHVDEDMFQTLLTKAKSTKPAAYYLNTASPRTYQNLFKQLRQLGVTEPVYSYHAPADPGVLKSLGALQNGVKFLTTPEVEKGSVGFERFLKSFVERYPDGPNIDFLLRTSYDAIMIIVKAVEAVGSDPEKVKKFLYENQFEGALGKVTFDSYGDVRGLNYAIKEIVDGKPELLR